MSIVENRRAHFDYHLEERFEAGLALQGWELFTAYVPGAKGALFMALIERTFGKAITTRTWETVARVARA